MSFLKLMRFVGLFCGALFTGLLYTFWYSITRTLNTLNASTYTEVEQSLIKTVDVQAPAVATTAVISNLIFLVGIRRHYRSRLFLLTFLGWLGLFEVTAQTIAINAPINMQVAKWPVDNPPSNWQQLRDRWNSSNSIRSVIALLALGCLMFAFKEPLPEQK